MGSYLHILYRQRTFTEQFASPLSLNHLLVKMLFYISAFYNQKALSFSTSPAYRNCGRHSSNLGYLEWTTYNAHVKYTLQSIVCVLSMNCVHCWLLPTFIPLLPNRTFLWCHQQVWGTLLHPQFQEGPNGFCSEWLTKEEQWDSTRPMNLKGSLLDTTGDFNLKKCYW